MHIISFHGGHLVTAWADSLPAISFNIKHGATTHGALIQATTRPSDHYFMSLRLHMRRTVKLRSFLY